MLLRNVKSKKDLCKTLQLLDLVKGCKDINHKIGFELVIRKILDTPDHFKNAEKIDEIIAKA
jgi:hypothetical protein